MRQVRIFQWVASHFLKDSNRNHESGGFAVTSCREQHTINTIEGQHDDAELEVLEAILPRWQKFLDDFLSCLSSDWILPSELWCHRM